MFSLNVIFFAFLAIRLATLRISIRNEKRLIQQGAVQYGKKNSLLLSVAHIAFYASAIIEANRYRAGLDATALAGLVLLVSVYLIILFVRIKQEEQAMVHLRP